ncbi:hypothetical protein T4A_2651 [Trichinella pseudospiralis]|uniref:Uncharacterized protein n=1 Tax=Trichinella pseudospiralis TaxID=6337 RepID=A0A0V1F280_TRIPS|nr:hypothetical protein T4A_2651 [Trichinella pseudospiralis]
MRDGTISFEQLHNVQTIPNSAAWLKMLFLQSLPMKLSFMLILFFIFTLYQSDADEKTNGTVINSAQNTTQSQPVVITSSPQAKTNIQSPNKTTTTTAGLQIHQTSQTDEFNPWKKLYGEREVIKDVLGCSWPEDLIDRYKFCVKSVHLENSSLLSEDPSEGLYYGLLNSNTLKILVEECKKGKCRSYIQPQQIKDTILIWRKNMQSINEFRNCLQKNTEGMARLCGIGSQLSTTISGMVGMHINIIEIILPALELEKDDKSECLIEIIEAAYYTATIYLGTEFYKRNSVFCWEVTQNDCMPICRQFAEIIQCMNNKCKKLKEYVKKVGIWQWYYLSENNVMKKCNLTEEDVCKSSAIGQFNKPSDSSNAGIKHLFNIIGEKFTEFKHDVEAEFHTPFYIVVATTLSVFFILIFFITLICMWRSGLILKRKRKTVRYSKIVPSDNFRANEEARALTMAEDDF